jgi:hypothetical protein
MALAWKVRNESYARGRFGSRFKTAMVNGIVTEVVREPTRHGGRPQTMITAAYDFGNNDIVSVKLHIHLIQLAPPPEVPEPVENPPVADAMVAPNDAEVTATIEARVNNGDDEGYQRPLLENMGPYEQAAMLARQAALSVLNPENPAAENPIVDPPNPPVFLCYFYSAKSNTTLSGSCRLSSALCRADCGSS